MVEEHGIDKLGREYKRTPNDFGFRWIEQDNACCSVCHGIGAKIEFRYVTRDYASNRQKGKICKTLQAHERNFWICPVCLTNLNKQAAKVKDLVKNLVKE